MASKKQNHVTLFSNGIGHFSRFYDLQPGQSLPVSIPFKKHHIGDVAASLQVFGPVRLEKPPTFTPANANATALRIQRTDAQKSLFQSLSGARVSVFHGGSWGVYTLLGTEQYEHSCGDNVLDDYCIVLMDTSNNICRLRTCEFRDVRFEDESVRAEIAKALRNNFQEIKPDSTLLELVMRPTGSGETQAAVQYTIPVAAWKMRYAIREDSGKFTLDGAAVVDNSTDEEWNDFLISVVTGTPISFDTDIATVSMPVRKFIQLVENTQGNVEVCEGSPDKPWMSPAGQNRNRRTCQVPEYGTGTISPKMSLQAVANYGNTHNYSGEVGLQQEAAGDANLDIFYAVAESPGVDSKDVGDFCVFTAKELISIPARRSAVVPMFSVPLNAAGTVLYYRESHHARRPYRAVKFKNESDYSLGRGKTVVYLGGVFAGECVLEMTKPNENRMLPHCLENGVRVVKESKPTEIRRHSIRLSEGTAVVETAQTAVTEYQLENRKAEAFKFVLEHRSVLAGRPGHEVQVSGVDVADREKVADDRRFYFKLGPSEKATVVVKETSLESTATFFAGVYTWFNVNIVDVSSPLSDDPQVRVCVAVHRQIDQVNRTLQKAQSRRKSLQERAERVRLNLTAAKDCATSQVADWVTTLTGVEDQINQIDEHDLPELNQKLEDLNTNLQAEMRKISVSWKEKERV